MSDSSHATLPTSHTRRRIRNYPTISKTSTTTITGKSAFCLSAPCGTAKSCRSKFNFFIAASSYAPRIDIYEVANGQATRIAYRSSDFSFGSNTPPAQDVDLSFAGFRIHAPINKPDYYDEVCVFLGASYFRAVAKGETYGLSARGLAINTGETKGEEFPLFKTFWIEKPAANANSIVVHALLDSESTTAAYRFTVRPGDNTVFCHSACNIDPLSRGIGVQN